MTVTVRACTPNDPAALALVSQAAFLDAFAGVLRGADILSHCRGALSEASYAGWFKKRDGRLWLAELAPGAAAVGYAGLSAPDLPLKDITVADIELKRIYVLARFYGTGLGKQLLETAMTEARSMAKTRMLLGVYNKNERAIAFYRKHGFEEIGTRQFQVGTGLYDDVILSRSLRR